MLNISLVFIAFLFMEFVAWSNHKYVMHGFLWVWHKDHHVNDRYKVTLDKMATARFEKNDLFFLVYAIPAIVLMIIGFTINMLSLVFVGIGITLYGFTYFLIHDILIHQRIKIPYFYRKSGSYTNAIIRAHLAHHRPKHADDFRNFGLLIFPLRFFKN